MRAHNFANSEPEPVHSTDYQVLNLDRGSSIAGRVQIAGTSATRRTGLLNADSLSGGAGLWIAPCEAIHTFGMRIPIDAIFLDKGLRVRKLHCDLGPRRISVCLSASSVLEVEAGAISRSTTEVGDRLAFRSGLSANEGE